MEFDDYPKKVPNELVDTVAGNHPDTIEYRRKSTVKCEAICQKLSHFGTDSDIIHCLIKINKPCNVYTIWIPQGTKLIGLQSRRRSVVLSNRTCISDDFFRCQISLQKQLIFSNCAYLVLHSINSNTFTLNLEITYVATCAMQVPGFICPKFRVRSGMEDG